MPTREIQLFFNSRCNDNKETKTNDRIKNETNKTKDK